MYYEVYVDVLFIENLWVNICLLLLTARILHIRTAWHRILPGAVTGSIGACALEVWSPYFTSAVYFLMTWLLAAVMICIAYREKHAYIKCLIVLYLEGFLLGGLIRYLEQFHRLAGVWLALISTGSAGVLILVEKGIMGMRRQRENVCQATLYLEDIWISTEGLVDTGNSLKDPVSGKPVSLCTEMLMQRLQQKAGKQLLPRLIPYRTIGEQGLLKAYVLDRMKIVGSDGTYVCEKPIIACMPMDSRQYELILHQELLSSQEEAT